MSFKRIKSVGPEKLWGNYATVSAAKSSLWKISGRVVCGNARGNHIAFYGSHAVVGMG